MSDGGLVVMQAEQSRQTRNLSILLEVSNAMASQITLSGDVQDFVLSPRADYAAVIGKQRIAVIDAKSGKQIATSDAFKRPAQFVFMTE